MHSNHNSGLNLPSEPHLHMMGSATNLGGCNSQLKEVQSEELNLTDYNTGQDKKSFMASEMVI